MRLFDTESLPPWVRLLNRVGWAALGVALVLLGVFGLWPTSAVNEVVVWTLAGGGGLAFCTWIVSLTIVTTSRNLQQIRDGQHYVRQRSAAEQQEPDEP